MAIKPRHIDELKAWTAAHAESSDWKAQLRELHAFSERWRQAGRWRSRDRRYIQLCTPAELSIRKVVMAQIRAEVVITSGCRCLKYSNTTMAKLPPTGATIGTNEKSMRVRVARTWWSQSSLDGRADMVKRSACGVRQGAPRGAG